MAKPNPFRAIKPADIDPVVFRRKELVRAVLQDMLAKVDDEDLQSVVFVGVTASGDIVQGRSVEADYFVLLGALERQRFVVNQLLDNVNTNSSETEY